MPEVKQNIAFVVDVAELRHDGTDLDDIVRGLVKLWTQVSACMVQLISGNQKLHGVTVGSIADHLEKQGLALVKSVLATRKKSLGLMKEIEKTAQKGHEVCKSLDSSLNKSDSDAFDDDDASMSTSRAIKEFLDLGLPPAVESEYSNTCFDVVSCRAAKLITQIQEVKMKFETACQEQVRSKNLSDSTPFESLQGGNAWKELPDEPTAQDFMRVAQATIINMLPARGMKDLFSQGTEVRAGQNCN